MSLDIPQDNVKLPPVTIDKEFLRQSRITALTIAMQNKPSPVYDNAKGQLVSTDYDVIGQAELIYQWLIKDL